MTTLLNKTNKTSNLKNLFKLREVKKWEKLNMMIMFLSSYAWIKIISIYGMVLHTTCKECKTHFTVEINTSFSVHLSLIFFFSPDNRRKLTSPERAAIVPYYATRILFRTHPLYLHTRLQSTEVTSQETSLWEKAVFSITECIIFYSVCYVFWNLMTKTPLVWAVNISTSKGLFFSSPDQSINYTWGSVERPINPPPPGRYAPAVCGLWLTGQDNYAVVTPLRKASSYEQHKTNLEISP